MRYCSQVVVCELRIYVAESDTFDYAVLEFCCFSSSLPFSSCSPLFIQLKSVKEGATMRMYVLKCSLVRILLAVSVSTSCSKFSKRSLDVLTSILEGNEFQHPSELNFEQAVAFKNQRDNLRNIYFTGK